MVIGGGVIGAAAYCMLAQAYPGRVVLVEKSRPGFGATAWSGGIVRCFHLDPASSDQALAGSRYYRDFADHTGIAVPYETCGSLWLADHDNAAAARAEVARLRKRMDVEWLDAQQLRSRFPMLRTGGLDGAVYEPQAGFMDPLAATSAWVTAGTNAGGRVLEGVELERPCLVNGRITGWETSAGALAAGFSVLCVGAWTPLLLKRWGWHVPFSLWSQALQMELFDRPSGDLHFPAIVDAGAGLYGRARSSGQIMLGSPTRVRDIDPDSCMPIDSAHSATTAALVADRLGDDIASSGCGGLRRYDAYTDSGRGWVGPLPDIDGLVLATGFSGGGFKYAPTVAQQLVQMARKCFTSAA